MNRLFEIKIESLIAVLFCVIFSLLINIGCGAVSTSGRYETSDTKSETTVANNKSAPKESAREETFDLTPFRPEIKLDDTEFITDNYSESSGAWYEFDEKSQTTNNKKIIGTEDGFRVQIVATDDLDEANRINMQIATLIPNQRTYVNFEPPFYKVKLGDFKENSEANDMRFRLSQLGFTESKVVRETINIFEK